MSDFGLVTIVIFLVALLILAIMLLLRKPKLEPDQLKTALLEAWQESGFSETLGQLLVHAREIKEAHKSLEQMLTTPTTRGAFGEIALEKLLSDQLPPDMYGIRKQLKWGKIPDAYIESTAGIICIDSKFPLENYNKMLNAQTPQAKENFKKQFISDVKKHLDKIARDYIQPQHGTASFAFAFIPSESVYWFLVTEAYETLYEYVKMGVQVVSPLTLAHKIELIKTGVHAQKISQQAERILQALTGLKKHFEAVNEKLNTLTNHIRNSYNKSEEVINEYRKLMEEFNKISDMKI